MATSDLTMTAYNALFTTDGLNTNVIAELDAALHNKTAVVQDDFAQQADTFVADAHGHLPNAVLIDHSVVGTDIINTSLDSSLHAIIYQHGDPNVGPALTINGTQNVFVTADDTAGAQITLADSGNDVVQAGNGGDTIDASASTGRDTLLGGTGVDVLVLGSGVGSVALSSSAGSALQTGGDHQLLAGMGADEHSIGHAHEVLYDGAGGVQTDINGLGDLLAGMASAARLVGTTTGDTVIGAATELDVSTGANTLIAGNGNGVMFNVGTTANDTIIGNSTSQVVTSQDATSTDVVSQVLNSHTGVTTMTLADGQVLKLANITTVNFADGSSVAVDPPANVNSYVADVVGAAEAHTAQAEAHVAAINAHWGHA